MTVTKIGASRKQEYDEFVSNNSIGSFLQSWAWGEWQISQNKTVSRYLFIQDGKIVGATQTIVMPTFLGEYCYCPHGPVWANNLSDEQIEQLLEILKTVLQKEYASLFVRIEPTVEINLQKLGAVKTDSVQPPQTLIKDISSPAESLLQSFHHKTRYNIKVAGRHGVQISQSKEVNSDVIKLIMETSVRQNYRNHSALYIEKLWQFFRENPGNLTATGYFASKEGAPLAAGLMMDFGKTRMYLFGGSNYEQRHLMAPYLMHWQAMQDAQAQGLSFYDFGASENASGHTGGYMRFKLGFTPQIVHFAGTHDLVLKAGKYTLYKLLRKLNRLRLHV
jgi:lipid II:glycine glycyltransferase (peptidoglycan interpeptide bridge formation enzyme)